MNQVMETARSLTQLVVQLLPVCSGREAHYLLMTNQYLTISFARYKVTSIAYGIGVFFIEFSAYDSG